MQDFNTNPMNSSQLQWGSVSQHFPLPSSPRGPFLLFGWKALAWKVKADYIKWFVPKEKLTQPDAQQITQF